MLEERGEKEEFYFLGGVVLRTAITASRSLVNCVTRSNANWPLSCFSLLLFYAHYSILCTLRRLFSVVAAGMFALSRISVFPTEISLFHESSLATTCFFVPLRH